MEYDFEILQLTPQQQFSIDIGEEVDNTSLCQQIKILLNKRSLEGWSPMTPFVMPIIWFSREKNK